MSPCEIYDEKGRLVYVLVKDGSSFFRDTTTVTSAREGYSTSEKGVHICVHTYVRRGSSVSGLLTIKAVSLQEAIEARQKLDSGGHKQ